MEDRDTLSPHEDPLLQLAMAIADGIVIDWSATPHAFDALSSNPSLAARLQDVERLVQGHSEVRAHELRIQSELHETLLTEERRTAMLADDEPFRVRWGPLVVIDKIGRGSFGDVYRAWDPRLDREVALKLVREGTSETILAAVEEGRLLARVRHPNVVTVYGAERVGKRVGVWMEYIRGRTLASEVEERGPFSAEESARVGVEVCRALEAVHRAGVIHRDIKAQNVMRDVSGRVVLGDFGTGVQVDESAPVTELTIAGTPLYCAPDVLNGKRASVASDLYSVGVLLYFLTTGEFPVRGRTVADIRKAHEKRARVPLGQAKPSLPEGFTEIVEALLEPGPDRPYGSAAAVENALTQWLGAASVTGAGAAGPGGVPWWSAPRVAAAAITIVFVAVGVWLMSTGKLRGFPRFAPQWLGGAPISRQIVNPPCAGVPPGDSQLIACVEMISHLLDRGEKPPPPVVLFNVETAETRILKRPGPQERILGAAISPDGNRVAFTVSAPGRPTEIRVIEIRGGAERVLLALPADVQGIALGLWSSANNRIECRLWLSNGSQTVALLAPDSGNLETIFQFATSPQSFSYSPDGRYIAFDVRQDETASERDIRVCDVLSKECAIVVAHPANDFFPIWSPNGQLLFNSDRAGTMGLWAVTLDGLHPSGTPELLRDIGRARIYPLGFTSRGELYYTLSVGDFDVFSAEIGDQTSGQPMTPVRLSPRAVDMNRSPVWSRDGRWLAYMSQRGPFSQYSATRVVIQAPDGSERAFRHDFRLNMSRLAWSPDGRTLALRGLRDNVPPRGVFGIHLIDRDTGRLVKTLSRRAPAEQFIEDQIGDIDWIDGSSIVFSSQQGLRVMDVATGEDRLIWQTAPGEQVQGMSLSPDAARIAMTVSSPDASWSAIRVTSASGSAPHELLRVSTPQVLWLQTWTADGQAILTTRWDRSVGLSARRERLWRLSYDGATASPLSLALAGLNEVRAHPDGRRLVFSAGAPQSEFWVLSGLGR